MNCDLFSQVVGYYTFHQPVVMIFDVDIAREVLSKNESTGRPHLEILKMRTFGELRGKCGDLLASSKLTQMALQL